MRPMLKYRGGKSKELNNYIHHFDNIEFERYIEPFFGGGATYFNLEPNNAIINDINTRLMNFYSDVRNNYDNLKNELYQIEELYKNNQLMYEQLKQLNPNEKVPNENEALYYRLRNEFNYPTGDFLDSTIYFYINKTAYSGMIRYNKKGEYNVPFGRYKNFNTDLINAEHNRLLQSAELFNLDYEEIFNMATPNDIMFLDPPYDCVFNDYGNLDLEDGFNEMEQRRLAENFRNLNTRALMVISATPLTEELYQNFIVDEYGKNYAVNIRNRFRNTARHLVIRNY